MLFCLNTAYPNYGYIGVPLAILAFGEQAAIPVSMLLVCDTIILLIMTNILSHSPESGRLSQALYSTFISMLKNPLLMSVLVGFAFSAMGFRIEGMPAIIAALFLGWPSAVPIDPLWIQVAILFACLPIAANVFALSQFYGIYQGRTATTIMLTTVIASLSVPAILYLLVTLVPVG